MSAIIQPAQVDFCKCNGLAIYKGSFWSVPVVVASRTNLVDTPIDLTGYEGRCVIKRDLNDTNPIAEPSVEVSTEQTGLFTISLGSNLSQNIPTDGDTYCESSTYQYEVRLIDIESQEEYRALYGKIEVIPSAIDSDD